MQHYENVREIMRYEGLRFPPEKYEIIREFRGERRRTDMECRDNANLQQRLQHMQNELKKSQQETESYKEILHIQVKEGEERAQNLEKELRAMKAENERFKKNEQEMKAKYRQSQNLIQKQEDEIKSYQLIVKDYHN